MCRNCLKLCECHFIYLVENLLCYVNKCHVIPSFSKLKQINNCLQLVSTLIVSRMVTRLLWHLIVSILFQDLVNFAPRLYLLGKCKPKTTLPQTIETEGKLIISPQNICNEISKHFLTLVKNLPRNPAIIAFNRVIITSRFFSHQDYAQI